MCRIFNGEVDPFRLKMFQEGNMRTKLAGISGYLRAASSALATTTAPTSPAPGATSGGIADYWWLIIVLVLVAVAVWYFMRGRTGTGL